MAWFVPRLFHSRRCESSRLNLHIDESRSQDLPEKKYLIGVVLHEHEADILTPISTYEERLSQANLADVPFHGKDLLHGNKGYASVFTGDRKRLLTQFARLVRVLPISFFSLKYSSTDTRGREELEAIIRRDLAALVFDHLRYFQSFDSIAVYYDGGQKVVSTALHDALDYVLARNVADYRDADHLERGLLQVADYICTIERVSDAYSAEQQTKTHERFFGSRRSFIQSYMKQLERKRLQ